MSDVNIQVGLPSSYRLPHETRDFGTTPFFKHLAPLNVAKSEEAGYEVYDPITEVVEIQLSGDRNYTPVMPAHAMARKEGNRVITYAELYNDQYLRFVEGDNQIAGGTALEELTKYGMTPQQLSICRALKIYSIEALNQIDGPKLKGLGMSANDIKAMAARFMDDRTIAATKGRDIQAMHDEIERLRALVEPAKTADEITEIIGDGDQFEAMDDDALKAYIEEKQGVAVRGKPNRARLLADARELSEL